MILYYCGEEMIKKLFQLIGLILLVHVVESLKAKKLPAELRVASATIVGCHHCSFVLADFIELEMPLFHRVTFEENSGSDKRMLRFLNQNGDKLREADVTEVGFSVFQNYHHSVQKLELGRIVTLLKKQGFYRRQRRGEKLSPAAEAAPFEPYAYSKSEL